MSIPPHRGTADSSGFEAVWQRIRDHEGCEFTTVTGLPLTYRAREGSIVESRSGGSISRASFAKAWRQWPVTGSGDFVDGVRSPSYVWAILSDPRIAGGT